MRSNRGRASRRHGGENSFWLSFSDLMSSLVLIIILVMFYIIYQYFNMVEINEAEIARRQYELDEAQTELETQKTALTEAEQKMISQQILLDAKQRELDDAEAVLESQQSELATTQSKLDELDAQLATQQSELESAQAQLATREQELETAQAQLSAQESALATAQAQLASQQSALEGAQAELQSQQVQIEQLVGLRTRIITSLSEALRGNNISATVDATNGSITLESDVLFATGRYDLTAQGRRFIDQFLPVYLNVLFSQEYRPYVSEIIIEGHTDSQGGYLPNLELSQQRALAVANYVLGESRAVTADQKNQLRDVVTVNGRSYSDRIFDARGQEDMDASRRVVFKFRLTDEQMIQQLRAILEG